jgi:hypothetical protein
MYLKVFVICFYIHKFFKHKNDMVFKDKRGFCGVL